jgi:DNA-binding XRE family transcriptional regulator
MGRKMSEVKRDLLQNEEFNAAYVGLEVEFALAAQLIEARKKADMTQDDVTKRIGTTQSSANYPIKNS